MNLSIKAAVVRSFAETELNNLVQGKSDVPRALAVADLSNVMLKSIELEIQAAKANGEQPVIEQEAPKSLVADAAIPNGDGITKEEAVVAPTDLANAPAEPAVREVRGLHITECKGRRVVRRCEAPFTLRNQRSDRSFHIKLPYGIKCIMKVGVTEELGSHLFGYSANWLNNRRTGGLAIPRMLGKSPDGRFKYYLVGDIAKFLIANKMPFAFNRELASIIRTGISHK